MEILTLEDTEKLRPFLKQAHYNEYNSNVVTMMMWQFAYPITYEIHEHFAVVKWHHGEECSWMMPLCAREYRKEAMDYMRSYCQSFHGTFLVSSATQEFVDWCKETYPNEFLYEDYEDAQDYVYIAEQHRTLSGKKMQKRRNHYNAFLKDYEGRFEYRALAELHTDDILKYLTIWKQHHDPSVSLDKEQRGIQFLLEHQKQLKLMGGGIFIDHELKAFLIASELSEDTLEIHVEKADKEIRGLYIAMLKHFLMEQDARYTYINREDDMGLEYLRTAKTNMKPAFKIKKYGIMINDVNIRKAIPEDTVQLQTLWMDSFPEETQTTTEFYFQRLYHMEDCYVIEQKQEILSMLQCRPMQMMVNGNVQNTSFIVGVATAKSYRHNGLMSKLVRAVLKELELRENFTILQAYDWSLYEQFGFRITHSRQNVQLQPKQTTVYYTMEPCDDAELLLDVYQTYCSSRNGYRIRDAAYYREYLIPYVKCEGGQIYVVRDRHLETAGYMVVYEQLCTEYLPLDDTANVQMQQLLDGLQVHTLLADPHLHVDGATELLPALMCRNYKEMKMEEPLFFSEML